MAGLLDSVEWDINDLETSTQKSNKSSQTILNADSSIYSELGSSSRRKRPKLDLLQSTSSSPDYPNDSLLNLRSESLPEGVIMSLDSDQDPASNSRVSYNSECPPAGLELSIPPNSSSGVYQTQAQDCGEGTKYQLNKLLDELTLDEFVLLESDTKHKLSYLLGCSAYEEMKSIANKLKCKDSFFIYHCLLLK